MKRVLLVCGYGCALTDGLERYLDRVSKFAWDWNPDILILSGGFTQQMSSHHVSEARVMEEYLVARNPKLICVIVRDEQAYTTPDNIKSAARILHGQSLDPLQCEIVVFCEATRALKVALLAKKHLGTVRIETAHFDDSPEAQVLATLLTLAGIRFPIIDRLHRWRRERRAERL